MEVLSLLNYLRGGGGGGGAANSIGANVRTTIASTLRETSVESDEEDDDEGSFFDLEFTVSDDERDNEETDSEDEEGDRNSAETDGDRKFNFPVSSGSSCCGRTDPNISFSPIEPSEPKFPVSFFKSATKFRVFMLGLKKSKSSTNKGNNDPKQPQQSQTRRRQQQQSKFFTVKFKVEEVPIVSLFTRDNSSRSSGNKINKQSSEEVASEEKKFAKDVVQKYLKMIKPLYVRVSKKYSEKLRFSGHLRLGLKKAGSVTAISSMLISSPTKKEVESEQSERSANNVRSPKQGNLQSGLRVVCKHLGKSRSASSAVAAVPTVPVQARRSDDSLLQQQDGIQSAILHCKRSFNASRDSDSSLLTRSMSDPSHEMSFYSSRNSSVEANVAGN